MSKRDYENDELLLESILLISDKDELRCFLSSLLTPREFNIISKRINIAANLFQGRSYSETAKYVGVSTITIGRVKQAMLDSKNSDICIKILKMLIRDL